MFTSFDIPINEICPRRFYALQTFLYQTTSPIY